MPTLTHDPDRGLWYLTLIDRPVARTLELHPHLHLDLDSEGRLVGVEGLGPVQWPSDIDRFYAMYSAGALIPMPLSELEGD